MSTQTDRQPGHETPSDYAHSPACTGRAATTGAETMSNKTKQIEVWVSGIYIVNIAGENETIRIEMPDGHSAMKAVETLSLSKDVSCN